MATTDEYRSDRFDYLENKRKIIQLMDEFDAEFPSEEHCVDAIFSALCPDGGIACRICNTKIFKREFGARYITCCGKRSWFTAGTCFHRIRKIRAWYCTIWLLDRGAILNSSILHQVLSVALSSAWKILMSLSSCLESRVQALGSRVHSANFLPVVCKRSRETPAGENPGAELMLIGENSLENEPNLTPEEPDSTNSLVKTDSPQISIDGTVEQDLANKIIDLLVEKPLNSQSMLKLCNATIPQLSLALINLELSGIVKRDFGDLYSLVSKKAEPVHSVDKELAALITSSIRFIRGLFHGVSLKYLQKYLALTWLYKNQDCSVRAGLLHNCLAEVQGLIMEPLSKRCSQLYVSFLA